jgi:HK97 family phage prohead protease
MEREIRNIDLEIVANEDSRTVEGYAIVFNSLSEDLGGFREQILPEAVDGVLERSDILALLNHDKSKGVLARSRYGKGSLTLEIDEKGLKYRFEAPHTALGDEVLEYLRRGEITSSSFAFTINEDIWEKTGEEYIRTIKSFKQLYDVSPVFEPAYQAATACKRFAEIQEEERKAIEEAKREADIKAAEEKRQALEDYYNNLKEENKKYL